MRMNVWYLIGAVWALAIGFALLNGEGNARWWGIAVAFAASVAFLFLAGYTAERRAERE